MYIWNSYGKNLSTTRTQLSLTQFASELSQAKMRLLEAQSQGEDRSYLLLQNSDRLQEIAREAKNDYLAAFALIKSAETLRMELHYRLGEVPQQDVVMQIGRAKDIYNQALVKAGADPSYAASAKFGLGLCEEELGNFDQAKQIYQGIIMDSSLEGTLAAAQAKQRLNTMADYRTKVVFKEPEELATEEPVTVPVPFGELPSE